MPTAADFRKIATALDGVVEGEHQAHPDFRVQGRVFATITADGTRGMVKVTPAQQLEWTRADSAFSPASGAWGRAGCTMVDLALVTKARLREAIVAAWANASAAGKRSR
ncbi:MAG: MmcQ/YjbR family DNA-binding protein [Planctomycetota bacterium]